MIKIINPLVSISPDCVTPEMFGAVGDGVTNDTQAITDALNHAIANGSKLVFAPKTYLVIPDKMRNDLIRYSETTSSCFVIEENQEVDIDLNGATLKTGNNSIVNSHIFLLFKTGRVSIRNGILIGDRNTNSNTNDGSAPIFMYDAKNVTIENVISQDSRGDGLFIGGVENGQGNGWYEFSDFEMNIVVRNFKATNQRRNGLTICKCRGVLFDNCVFENSNGQSPEAGVDIEPNWGRGSVFDVTFVNCKVAGNALGGMFVQNCEGVRIDGCDSQGVILRGAYDVLVTDSNIDEVLTKGADVTFRGNKIRLFNIQPNNISYEKKYSILLENNIFSASNANGEFNHSPFSASLGAQIHDKLIVRNNTFICYVKNDPLFGFGMTAKEFEHGVYIQGNTIFKSGEGLNKSVDYAGLLNVRYEDVYFTDNDITLDIPRSYDGNPILAALDQITVAKFARNTIEMVREQEGVTYNPWFTRMFKVLDSEGASIYVGSNIFNTKNNAVSINQVECIYSDAAITAHVNNNYLYDVDTVANENVTLLSCFNNILNNESDAYNKSQIDEIMGSYITDVDALIGGES